MGWIFEVKILRGLLSCHKRQGKLQLSLHDTTCFQETASGKLEFGQLPGCPFSPPSNERTRLLQRTRWYNVSPEHVACTLDQPKSVGSNMKASSDFAWPRVIPAILYQGIYFDRLANKVWCLVCRRAYSSHIIMTWLTFSLFAANSRVEVQQCPVLFGAWSWGV